MSDTNPVSSSGPNVPAQPPMVEIPLTDEAAHVNEVAPRRMTRFKEKGHKLAEHQVSNLTEALGSAVKEIKHHPNSVKNIVVEMMLMMAVALIVVGVAGSIFPFAGGFFIGTGAMVAIATLVVSHPEAFAAEGKDALHGPPLHYRDPEQTSLLQAEDDLDDDELRRLGLL